jgi:hypothetical protein
MQVVPLSAASQDNCEGRPIGIGDTEDKNKQPVVTETYSRRVVWRVHGYVIIVVRLISYFVQYALFGGDVANTLVLFSERLMLRLALMSHTV